MAGGSYFDHSLKDVNGRLLIDEDDEVGRALHLNRTTSVDVPVLTGIGYVTCAIK